MNIKDMFANLLGFSGENQIEDASVVDLRARQKAAAAEAKAEAEAAATARTVTVGIYLPITEKINNSAIALSNAITRAVFEVTTDAGMKAFESGLSRATWDAVRGYSLSNPAPMVKMKTFFEVGPHQAAAKAKLEKAYAKARQHQLGKASVYDSLGIEDDNARKCAAALASAARKGVNGENPAAYDTTLVFVKVLAEVTVSLKNIKDKTGGTSVATTLTLNKLIDVACAHPQQNDITAAWMSMGVASSGAMLDGIVAGASAVDIAEAKTEDRPVPLGNRL